MEQRTRRTTIVLSCSECKARNYKTTKRTDAGDSQSPAPIELKKFCKECQKHTMHKETK